MKRIEVSAWGPPEQVARCVEAPDLEPGAGEVVFDVLAFPINPADVAFCKGLYRLKPPLPATPGAECLGRVKTVGAGVSAVAPGDLVINLQRENWASQRCAPEADVIRIPADVEPLQAAMLRINPPTAALLLSDVADLKPGDWVIQNVANSAVGRLVIHFARERGLRTLNVVRRKDVFGELKALGADACVLDGPDLAGRAREAAGGATIPYGLDAVAGAATARLGACVADGGTVCCYGAMSGEDVRLGTAELVYRGVTLTGFMLGRFLARRSIEDVRALYADLAASMRAGAVRAPVDSTFAIEDIGAALVQAQAAGRHGKVLVTPGGRP